MKLQIQSCSVIFKLFLNSFLCSSRQGAALCVLRHYWQILLLNYFVKVGIWNNMDQISTFMYSVGPKVCEIVWGDPLVSGQLDSRRLFNYNIDLLLNIFALVGILYSFTFCFVVSLESLAPFT